MISGACLRAAGLEAPLHGCGALQPAALAAPSPAVPQRLGRSKEPQGLTADRSRRATRELKLAQRRLILSHRKETLLLSSLPEIEVSNREWGKRKDAAEKDKPASSRVDGCGAGTLCFCDLVRAAGLNVITLLNDQPPTPAAGWLADECDLLCSSTAF